MKLKTVRIPRGYAGLHCEVDGCIVNIRIGLIDMEGRKVTNVQIIPDIGQDDTWQLLDGAPGVTRVGKIEGGK